MRRKEFLLVAALAALPAFAAEFNFTKIIDTTTPVPESGATFVNLGTPVVHGSSTVFQSTLTQDGSGIYIHNEAGLKKVVDTATTVPGETVKFGAIFNGSYSVESNRVAFSASWNEGARQGLFLWENGSYTILAKSGDAVPGSAGKIQFFGEPKLDGGKVYGFAGLDSNERAVFEFSPTGHTRLFGSPDLYPGTTEVMGYSSQIAIENGVIAFWGALNANTNAIFKYENGQRTIIASRAEVAPGLNQNFTTFNSPPDLDFGQVAFVSANNAPKGLYLRPINGDPIVKLADTGTPAPGAPNNFLSFDTVAIAGPNQAYLLAVGGAKGIYYYDHGQLSRVVDAADLLGGSSIIAPHFFMNPGSADGQTLTFTVHLPGRKAIYRTGVVASPEPREPAKLVVDTLTPLPGSGEKFTTIYSAHPFNGGYAFFAISPTRSGTFFSKDGNVQFLVPQDIQIPGTSSNTVISPIYGGSDQLILTAFGPGTYRGIYTHKNGETSLVIDNRSPIAGVTATTFSAIPDGNAVYVNASAGADFAIVKVENGVTTTMLASPFLYPGSTQNFFLQSFDVEGGKLVVNGRAGTDFASVGLFSVTGGAITKIVASMDTVGGRILGRPAHFNVRNGKVIFGAGLDGLGAILESSIDNPAPRVLIDSAAAFPELPFGPSGEAGVRFLGVEPSGSIYLYGQSGSRAGMYRLTSGGLEILGATGDSSGTNTLSFLSAPGVGEFDGETFMFSGRYAGQDSGLFAVELEDATPQVGGAFSPGSIVVANGNMKVTFTGVVGQAYRIETSASLAGGWTSLMEFTYSVPVDVNAQVRGTQRYYRAVTR